MRVHSSPLIGRRRELALIDQILGGAASGTSGTLVVIRGEAGIGKSRLAEEMAANAEASGFTVARGRCWPLGGAPPLWPWHEVLDTLAGSEAAGLLEERGGGPDIDPERFARFRAVADLLTACSEPAPVLIVLDDMHAADAGAVLLVRFLARLPRLRRVVLVVTHREPLPDGEAVTSALEDLERDGAVLRLAGLSEAEVRELATHHGRPLEANELAAVQYATRGNPLLVEDLVATATSGAIDTSSAAIRRTISTRLLDVPPATRGMLSAAAVLGAQSSIDELAAVCEVPATSIDAARREAIRTGMIDPSATSIIFVHDMFREAVLGELDRAEVMAWHLRAAAVLSPGDGSADVERLVRWAHHALAASASGPSAATTAIDACRRAARAMMGGFAYEAATELLRSAVDLARRTQPTTIDPALLLELARATLASGSLAAARPAFRLAAEAAERDGDAQLLAEAALGLGGTWVLEHRQLEQEDYHALLARAQAALGDTRPDLAARLRVRLAAERTYLGGTVAEVERATADVRATNDNRGLPEALSLEHNVKLGPAYADERLAIAEEVIRTASASGDGVLTLMGLMWRTVDLLLLGRPEAERSLVELRQRTDALGVESVRLVVKNIEVMQLLRAGRFDDAERAAEACLEAGTRIGDADATAWYGGQILARRWFEGRGAELLPLAAEMAQSPTLAMTNQVFTAAWAALAAEAGEPETAQLALERLRAGGGLAAIAQSSALLLTVFCAVEAAAAVGDAETAAEAYTILEPYAALPMVGSLGVVCFGSVERTLGIAARTTGEPDRAIAHLDRAVDGNRRLGNRPMHAITRANLAEALLERDGPGDRDRADALLRDAIDGADALAMDRRAATWQTRRDQLVRVPVPSDHVGRLRRLGDQWEVTAGSERTVVPDSLGMQYLARLLGTPGRSVSVGELTGRDESESHHPVLDERAKDAYRRRLSELRADIDEADADADLEKAARLRLELDALTDELTRMLRPGGRSRAFAGGQERARTAVQKAIRRAIDRIGVEAPDLADGLRRAIRTGTHCSFDPAAGVPSRWVIA